MSAGVSDTDMFVTMSIANQRFGIPVLKVRDVLRSPKITHVPLAPVEVVGSLNLRGRIVTAIDVRKRMGLSKFEDEDKSMSIVVEHDGELYSLIVDTIGDVMRLPNADFERNPSTLDPVWRGVSDGIYRLENDLLIVLSVERLLDI
ncbi:MAG: chemotaxis protein CheW [Alphaproteobacteria bacterium]|nr:chemotaxis protein CheW [Alphaproteobacteria bacterium]MCL2505001.1 chemotaxis protein CheW [Alphaproteobacteria bacterium]